MDYITVKEASELWNIDISTIGKLLRAGKIQGSTKLGGHWIIPKNCPKPIDGRTKNAKLKQNSTVFRLPLYINSPEEAFIPPLSLDEAQLRQAQKLFYACEFQKAKAILSNLSENTENIYVKISANYYMCMLSVSFDNNISWKHYYLQMNLLLSKDLPYKNEMELFLQLFDIDCAQYMHIPKDNINNQSDLHPTAIYLYAYLSIFKLPTKNYEEASLQYLIPYESICQLMNKDGHYLEEQKLHLILFVAYYATNNTKLMLFHIEKAIKIAYEYNLIYYVADAEYYYADVINSILNEYPESFAEEIRKSSKIIYKNFAKFANNSGIANFYSLLSKNDYRYITYTLKGLTNKQIADFLNISERTVAKRYNDIYNKLGVSNKHELSIMINSSFGVNLP